MPKQGLRVSEAPVPAGPYSHATIANGFLFSAGLGPQIPGTGCVPAGIADQTRQVLRNLQSILSSAGLTLDDVVKTTVHLQDLEGDFPDFNAAYGEFFAEPFPVRTTVGSSLANILVEIDVIAALNPA